MNEWPEGQCWFSHLAGPTEPLVKLCYYWLLLVVMTYDQCWINLTNCVVTSHNLQMNLWIHSVVEYHHRKDHCLTVNGVSYDYDINYSIVLKKTWLIPGWKLALANRFCQSYYKGKYKNSYSLQIHCYVIGSKVHALVKIFIVYL